MPKSNGELATVIGVRLNSPMLISIVVGILYVLFLNYQLIKHDYDWSAFVTAGGKYSNSIAAPESLSILKDSPGYDGQFYYRLALTPFTDEKTDFGVTLDMPKFRQQRIVYPLLSKVFSLGQIEAVPASLVLVNFLALPTIGWLGARYSQAKGRHAVWGFAFALYPGFLLSLSRDTPEIIAACFMLAAILSLALKRDLLASGLLVLAVLSKETALVLAIGILLAAMLSKDQFKSKRLLIALGSIIAYLIWQIWLSLNWSIPLWSIGGLTASFGVPFFGLTGFAMSIFPPQEYRQVIWLVELLSIAGTALVVIRAVGNSRADPFIKISWLFYALLLVSATRAIWVEDWSFVRVFSEFWIFSILIILESAFRLKEWILRLSMTSWFLLAIDVVLTR